jgi:hypothetical protein
MSLDPDPPPDGRLLPRRGTDRVEDAVAWLLTAAALVLLVVAGLAGLAVHGRNAESATTMNQVRAVLLEEAKVDSIGEPGMRLPVQVQAGWTDRRGVEHVGEIVVRTSSAAGTEVDVWLGADGKIATMGLDRRYPALAGIVTAAGLLLGGWVLLGVAWCGVRRLTAVCNSRLWEREWARVGPEWSGRRL